MSRSEPKVAHGWAWEYTDGGVYFTTTPVDLDEKLPKWKATTIPTARYRELLAAERELKELLAKMNMKLQGVAADARRTYPPADVAINAPLALIQVELDTTFALLTWLLAKPATKRGRRT